MKLRLCNVCEERKPLSEFSKIRRLPGEHVRYCKPCGSKRTQVYKKTISGLINQTYSNQKASSKRRGHPMPSYTKKELEDWLLSQNNFSRLYKTWQDSGYERELVPSVDRIDDTLHYFFDNIRLVSWRENKLKYVEDVMRTTHPRVVGVNQYTMDGKYITTFPSMIEAASKLGIHASSISEVVRGNNGRKSTSGFQFKSVKDVEGTEDIPPVTRGRGKGYTYKKKKLNRK